MPIIADYIEKFKSLSLEDAATYFGIFGIFVIVVVIDQVVGRKYRRGGE